MSEKRLIDWDGFYRFITSLEIPTQYTSSETNQLRKKAGKYWDGLSRPSLPDVTGTRTLDSMTDDEIEELVKLYAGDFIGILLTHRNGDKDIYIEYTDVGQRKALIIYPGELSVGGKEVKIFKWFLEKGFNVWEGK